MHWMQSAALFIVFVTRLFHILLTFDIFMQAFCEVPQKEAGVMKLFANFHPNK